ncbi:MAG: DUF4468 domain-containing protein [Cytophagaceae bacterium]|nr:DUF4468 domain-containing protein [Cytophagaceae bacterium]MDW8457367.1 DUF4468 domain-containing protein [Cytophagaceae bacterium]
MEKGYLYAFTAMMAFMVNLNLLAQSLPTDNDTKKITYQETVIIDSVTRDVLYERCKYWIANYYKTDKYDVDDKANFKVLKEGFFIVKLTYDIKYKAEHNVTYTVSFHLKDGKYRITITDFTIYNVSTGPKTKQSLEVALSKMSSQNKTELTAQVNKEVNNIIEDIKKVMKKGAVEDKDDW